MGFATCAFSLHITSQILKFRTKARIENEAKNTLPQGFTVDYAGESRQLRVEGSKFLGMFFLSAILIYLVLAAQFENLRDPFIILAGSVPLALSGALMFSFLGLTTLNIYSQVGLITLVGLIAKNGILIVEFANHLQEAGKSKLEAIIEAAGTRLRPFDDFLNSLPQRWPRRGFWAQSISSVNRYPRSAKRLMAT